MARLPTVADFGARPTPRPYTGSPATNPNAGAVAKAIGDIGGQIAGLGQQAIEKEDKLNFAAAQAVYMKEDMSARAELLDDPDFDTFDKRYSERMQKAKALAAGLIKSRSDRSLFESGMQVDFERGRAEVGKMARDKRVVAGKATTVDGLNTFQHTYITAMDAGTRDAALKSAGEMIDGAVAKGYFTPLEAVNEKKRFAGTGAYGQIMGMVNRDEIDGANKFFAANGHMLTPDQYTSIEGRLKGFNDTREAASRFERATGYVYPTDGEVEQPSIGAMLKAIRTQESGGQHFGKDGKAKVSSAGAVGLMQVMPATGPEAAKLAGLEWDAGKFRNDPSYNKALGEAYFKEMLRQFDDPVVAAAAYNAGPGAVRKALKKGGNWLQALPKETRDYVAAFERRTGARQSARRWNKEDVYGNIDALADAEGWSFEMRERTKDYADGQITRDEQLMARKENDADRSASEFILGQSEGFTDVSQIPRGIWSNMSTSARASAMAAAKANVKEKKPQANGDIVTSLELMRIKDPARFAQIPLGQYAHEMTPAELNQLRIDQAEMQVDKGQTFGIASKVSGTIGRYDTPDLWDKDRGEAARQRVRIQRIMESDIKAVTGGKRAPTDDELYKAFISATGDTVTLKKTFMGIETGGTVERRRFEMRPGDVPPELANRITAALKSRGIDPTDERVAEEYQMYKGRYW